MIVFYSLGCTYSLGVQVTSIHVAQILRRVSRLNRSGRNVVRTLMDAPRIDCDWSGCN